MYTEVNNSSNNINFQSLRAPSKEPDVNHYAYIDHTLRPPTRQPMYWWGMMMRIHRICINHCTTQVYEERLGFGNWNEFWIHSYGQHVEMQWFEQVLFNEKNLNRYIRELWTYNLHDILHHTSLFYLYTMLRYFARRFLFYIMHITGVDIRKNYSEPLPLDVLA